MTKTKTAAADCAECAIGSFTRNNYFTGKLLVERDFTDEQRYYIDKLRLHQQRLHGEGVVCGLQVVPHANAACRDRFVCVKPGFAKDCCGHDILVTREECIDITEFDAWKTLAKAADRSPHRLQICVRYKECPTEDIPVLYDDCGCDDTACAPNRILESYEFGLIVDGPLPPGRSCLPALTGKGPLPIAQVAQVTLQPGTGHLFVLAAGASWTVHRVNASTHTIEASHTLPGPGKGIALSDDGARLYAMVYDTAAAGLVLEVLDATTLAVLSASAAVADAGTSPVELAVMPQATGRLAVLHEAGGRFAIWDVASTPPVEQSALVLGSDARSLVLGADRTTAYCVERTKKIAVLDLATTTMTTELAQVTDPWQIVTANSAGSDVLAVIDRTNATIAALDVAGAQVIASFGLDEAPIEEIPSPDRSQLFLITNPAASTIFHLRAFDLERLLAGHPAAPGPGLVVQRPTRVGASVADAHALYYTETTTLAPEDATVFELSPHPCPDLYAIEDCVDCDQPDCLVLATISGYGPGFRVEASTTPPTAPAADYAAQVARIDNALGRKVLPSTQKIAEVLDCLIECGKGGLPGPQGDPGVGTPGLGLNPGLPKIIDVGWEPNVPITWHDFVERLIYKVDPIKEIRDPFQAGQRALPWITLFFNEKMEGLSRQTFSVEIEVPQMLRPGQFTGLYSILRLRLYGFIMDLGPTTTPHTGEPAKSAWTFIPYNEFFLSQLIQPTLWQLLASYQPAPEFPEQKLDLPTVRVKLLGDFVYSPDLNNVYDENRLLDGDNIGGLVGVNRTRGGPVLGGKNPSGDMELGGDFEAWFTLSGPTDVPTTTNDPGGYKASVQHALFGSGEALSINNAPAEELLTLPGVTAATAKRIVAERRRSKFKNAADLKQRLGLSEDIAAMLSRIVEF